MDPKVKTAASRIKRLSPLRPKLAIVLGSGFGEALRLAKCVAAIRYSQLPGFSPAGVAGHSGELLVARLGGVPVLILSGRAHFYEGHSMGRVTFAVRALVEYGIKDLLLTNAAGGINPRLRPGDFMAIADHMNWMGTNPLRGDFGGRSPFVDLSCAYDPKLLRLLVRSGKQAGIRLRTGVYLAVCGPSYETPAEIRGFARLGADAVGMSTVPEAIVARQCGLRVAGVSCITNLAAGCGTKPLSHEEVLKTGERVKSLAAGLLKNFAVLYAQTS